MTLTRPEVVLAPERPVSATPPVRHPGGWVWHGDALAILCLVLVLGIAIAILVARVGVVPGVLGGAAGLTALWSGAAADRLKHRGRERIFGAGIPHRVCRDNGNLETLAESE